MQFIPVSLLPFSPEGDKDYQKVMNNHLKKIHADFPEFAPLLFYIQ
jgi:hypothetical protein